MNNSLRDNENLDFIIQPKAGWFEINARDIWRYKDLIFLFVKRDFSAFYKQTILGPLWYIIQPLFTTIVFTIVFGKIARIPTDGIQPFLFYLAGMVTWNYFAECLKTTSNTFVLNANIFGKVYFPRLIVPISVVIVNMVQFFIQLMLFMCFYLFFIAKGESILPSKLIFFLPVIVVQMALLGLGLGILVSSLTTKYRDLSFAMGFVIQIWMYISPVVYPTSNIPLKYQFLYMLNPMAPIIEIFRYMFLGVGTVTPICLLMSWFTTILAIFFGVLLFNRIEKSFMDTV
ncbi:MAG: ABC transporter permease [Prolixibacteraceae bacterium]|nr:ABC transporter permease [Prolixibacteraceae bacterium]